MLLFGTALSIILGIKLAQRFIVPINLLADAAKKISHGDLSARVENRRIILLKLVSLWIILMIWLKN